MTAVVEREVYRPCEKKNKTNKKKKAKNIINFYFGEIRVHYQFRPLKYTQNETEESIIAEEMSKVVSESRRILSDNTYTLKRNRCGTRKLTGWNFSKK